MLGKTTAKGSKGRNVLLNAQAQAEIAIYVRALKNATPHDPLFRSRVNKRFSANSLCQVFLRIYDDAGLDKATSHSGRRTFITTLAHKRRQCAGETPNQGNFIHTAMLYCN